jgi:hypothetical protein
MKEIISQAVGGMSIKEVILFLEAVQLGTDSY